jgi:hypothetical protein
LVFVAHTQDDLDKYAPRARQVGDYMSQWGVRYEEIRGSEYYLRQLTKFSSDLESADDDFLVIHPGGELTQRLFIHL